MQGAEDLSPSAREFDIGIGYDIKEALKSGEDRLEGYTSLHNFEHQKPVFDILVSIRKGAKVMSSNKEEFVRYVLSSISSEQTN